jgi:hypothetical protein
LSYALKGKLPAGLCLIILGTEGTIPPIRAESVRFMPSRTAASDKRCRLWFASDAAAASRRGPLAEKSLRNFTADAIPRILAVPWNQISPEKGTPTSQNERPLVLPAISAHFATRADTTSLSAMTFLDLVKIEVDLSPLCQ